MLIGIAVSLFLIIFSLTQSIVKLNEELHKECSMPPEICPAKRGTMPPESVVGFTIAGILGILGVFLIISGRQVEKITTKKTIKFKQAIKTLRDDEKKVYETVASADGSIFQSDLVQKIGYSKVKVSRILDRLETKGIVERRRRGMTNMIILKD